MRARIANWLTPSVKGRPVQRESNHHHRPRYNSYRPRLEPLEDRLPPGSLLGLVDQLPVSLLDVASMNFFEDANLLALGFVKPAAQHEGGPGPSSGNSVSGEAFGVSVNVNVAGVPVSVPRTPDVVLPPEGGLATAELLNISVPGVLRSDTLIVMTSGAISASSANAESSATVENVNVVNGLVTADLVVAMSTCTSNGSTATCNAAGSTLLNLTVNGTTLGNITPAPNTTISVPGVATVILNEQISGGDGVHSASLTVNMIHVLVNAPLLTGDIIVSSAHSDVNFTAPPPPPPPGRLFMTGGGRLGTDQNIATFGAHAGISDGVTSGQVEYHDHPLGLNVRSTSVTSFGLESGSSNCVTYSGSATVNGNSGYSFTVSHDCDNGEPGVGRDTFRISVTGPAGFTYASFPRFGDILTGGNRELH